MSSATREAPLTGRGLTARQTELWALIAEGLSNRQIADRLFLAEKTVKNHVTALFAILGCHSRAQAAVAFLRTGAAALEHIPAGRVERLRVGTRPLVRLQLARCADGTVCEVVTPWEARHLAAELLKAAAAADGEEVRRYRGERN